MCINPPLNIVPASALPVFLSVMPSVETSQLWKIKGKTPQLSFVCITGDPGP